MERFVGSARDVIPAEGIAAWVEAVKPWTAVEWFRRTLESAADSEEPGTYWAQDNEESPDRLRMITLALGQLPADHPVYYRKCRQLEILYCFKLQPACESSEGDTAIERVVSCGCRTCLAEAYEAYKQLSLEYPPPAPHRADIPRVGYEKFVALMVAVFPDEYVTRVQAATLLGMTADNLRQQERDLGFPRHTRRLLPTKSGRSTKQACWPRRELFPVLAKVLLDRKPTIAPRTP